MADTVRVVRVLIYEGPREWVERIVRESIHGTKNIPDAKFYKDTCRIYGRTLDEFPLVIPQQEEEPTYPYVGP